jgi:hypothetical protein
MGKISVAGVSLEDVPGWAVSLVAVIIVSVVAFGLWWKTVRDPSRQLVTLREANNALHAEVEEYNKHIGEVAETTSVLMNDVRGKLTAGRYNDGCILLTRTIPGGLKSKLIADLALDLHGAEPKAFNWPAMPVVEAQGRCLNPHPGVFTWSYGQKNGCWVEVWRRFQDGCTHVQMLDA